MLSRIKAWFSSSSGGGSSGAANARPRERLSDYQLGETLGKGSMSEVKKAFHKKTFRAVAVKILTPESRQVTSKIEQTFRHMTEGEVAMLFDHPGIIKTLGWGRDGKNEFIIMEYFEGILLRDLLHEARLNPKQNRMDIFLQVAEALEHVHSKGIVHRDFCPRNILVNGEGSVRIFDFGLAVELELVKKTKGNRTGTLAYMAPELIKRQFTDQRCDIYALGITMYEIFAGQRPFLGIDNVARLMQLMNAVADPPSKLNPNISPELEKIILKAIEKNPDKRFTTVREMLDAIAPILEQERPKWNVSPPTPDTTILQARDLAS
jgi:eukaryotic-like serine/threonine-protein kinase